MNLMSLGLDHIHNIYIYVYKSETNKTHRNMVSAGF